MVHEFARKRNQFAWKKVVWGSASFLAVVEGVSAAVDDHNWFTAMLGGAFLGLFCSPVALLVAWVIHVLRRRRRDAALQRQLAEERRLRAVDAIIQNANAAIRSREALPGRSEDARRHVAEARRYFTDRAYSPFWSSVESACAEVGKCSALVDTMGQCVERHPVLVADALSLGCRAEAIPTFPAQPDMAGLRNALLEPMNELAPLVYDAQREATFALIWEQRRTTSTIVTGFGSLEQAVNTMQLNVTRSIDELQGSLDSMAARTERQLTDLTTSVKRAAAVQTSQLASIDTGVVRIHDELRLQRPAHLRD